MLAARAVGHDGIGRCHFEQLSHKASHNRIVKCLISDGLNEFVPVFVFFLNALVSLFIAWSTLTIEREALAKALQKVRCKHAKQLLLLCQYRSTVVSTFLVAHVRSAAYQRALGILTVLSPLLDDL